MLIARKSPTRFFGIIYLTFFLTTACNQNLLQADKVVGAKKKKTTRSTEPPNTLADLTLKIKDTAFKNNGLNLKKINYEFYYLGRAASGPVRFKDDQAEIKVKKVAADIKGELELIFTQNKVKVLSGNKKELKLTKGENTENIRQYSSIGMISNPEWDGEELAGSTQVTVEEAE